MCDVDRGRSCRTGSARRVTIRTSAFSIACAVSFDADIIENFGTLRIDKAKFGSS